MDLGNILEFEKAEARDMVHQLHAETLELLTGGATIQERDTWPVKETAARAFIGETASPSDLQMLGTEAVFTGLPLADLAAHIVAKAEAFKSLVGLASGMRAKGLQSIEACQTVEQVAAVVQSIETEVENAKQGNLT